MSKKKKKATTAAEAVLEQVESVKLSGEPLIVKNWTLSTGVQATLIPVPPSLVQDVQVRIKDPQVPTWHNPDKDRDEPNPLDPGYLSEKEQAFMERNQAVVDAVVMFGIELEPGYEIPDDFVSKLRRLGIEFDENDPAELEFRFKKYSAGTEDLRILMRLSGIDLSEDIEGQRELFRS